jgi:hypothetical protein
MSPLCQPLQTSAVLALDLREAPAHDLALRNQHEIEPTEHLVVLVSPEALSEKPLGPVPLHGSADAPAHRQPQAADITCVLRGEQNEEGAIEPESLPEHPSKLRRAPDPFAWPQSSVRQPSSSRLDGDPLASLFAAPLQDEPAPFCTHANEETVRPLATAIVRLKCPLALHVGDPGAAESSFVASLQTL